MSYAYELMSPEELEDYGQQIAFENWQIQQDEIRDEKQQIVCRRHRDLGFFCGVCEQHRERKVDLNIPF